MNYYRETYNYTSSIAFMYFYCSETYSTNNTWGTPTKIIEFAARSLEIRVRRVKSMAVVIEIKTRAISASFMRLSRSTGRTWGRRYRRKTEVARGTRMLVPAYVPFLRIPTMTPFLPTMTNAAWTRKPVRV